MSLALLFPLGLAALAALALPLLIHLVRREEQRPTDFAALRWLSARLKPRARIRFEDLVLLALRLALVATLALLLARPVLFGGAGDAPWLLVLPGADPTAAPPLPEGAQRRWLAPGFPSLDAPRPTEPVAVSSLLRQLDAELPALTPVTVLVPAVFDGADGERPRLARRLDWRIVAGETPTDTVPPSPAPRLAVRHAPEREPALRYLRAAAAAWTALHAASDAAPDAASADAPSAAPLDVAGADAALPATDRPLVWLVPGELPAALRDWLRSGGHALIEPASNWPLPAPGVPAWRADDGTVLARSAAFGRGRLSQLQHPLAPDVLPALLDAGFPRHLHDLLHAPAPAPTRADAAAHVPLAGGPGFPETPRPLDTPLLWAAVALFALERLWATRRRPEAQA
ncbi:BatA domain-containing protein [Arenimonas terrae]|uniref:Aerotolerance regulator N-terminal domain-containing protein n=1 Tax=Arenimonas terrae TaxID=2546226 RepID=A0A5C4RY83_9GAMM|nr:BatA domain-containing protein [Arenimonas terrae]TNJ35641.1 hypothetical protein E1B00_07805 [Arenimonas terrae]